MCIQVLICTDVTWRTCVQVCDMHLFLFIQKCDDYLAKNPRYMDFHVQHTQRYFIAFALVWAIWVEFGSYLQYYTGYGLKFFFKFFALSQVCSMVGFAMDGHICSCCMYYGLSYTQVKLSHMCSHTSRCPAPPIPAARAGPQLTK